jgi:predicted dinucleotide-binding enzyme
MKPSSRNSRHTKQFRCSVKTPEGLGCDPCRYVRHGRRADHRDIAVLALPYGAVADVLSQYAGELDGKVILDLTNPVDFATFHSFVVPVGSSAAAVIAETLPGSSVLKTFNITFAATLASGSVGAESTPC